MHIVHILEIVFPSSPEYKQQMLILLKPTVFALSQWSIFIEAHSSFLIIITYPAVPFTCFHVWFRPCWNWLDSHNQYNDHNMTIREWWWDAHWWTRLICCGNGWLAIDRRRFLRLVWFLIIVGTNGPLDCNAVRGTHALAQWIQKLQRQVKNDQVHLARKEIPCLDVATVDEMLFAVLSIDASHETEDWPRVSFPSKGPYYDERIIADISEKLLKSTWTWKR